jgi:hypothetical protein
MLPIGKTNQLHYATLSLNVEFAVSADFKLFQLPFYRGGWAKNSHGNAELVGPALQERKHSETATIESVQFAEIEDYTLSSLAGLNDVAESKGSFALNQPSAALHHDRLVNLEYLRREHCTLLSMASVFNHH